MVLIDAETRITVIPEDPSTCKQGNPIHGDPTEF